LSSTSSSTISASTRRGSVRRNVPSGVNSWRQLCPVKDAPVDDDDDMGARPNSGEAVNPRDNFAFYLYVICSCLSAQVEL